MTVPTPKPSTPPSPPPPAPPPVATVVAQIRSLEGQLQAARAQLDAAANATAAGTVMVRSDGVVAVFGRSLRMSGVAAPAWYTVDPNGANGTAIHDQLSNVPGTGTWTQVHP